YIMRGIICLSTLLLVVAAFPSNLTVRRTRQAYPNKAWPNALLPIGYRSNYPEAWKASVRAGMKTWEARTCIRFRDNDVTSKDRIEVYDGGQCSSALGREGGKQTYSLGSSCQGVSSAAHELGHAIGIHHMQVRPDRDQYVTVNKNNIKPGAYDLNFAIATDTSTMGLPYDYASIMHYGPFHFSQEGAPGMVPRDTRFRNNMGGLYPSFYDALRVNKMYNCDAKCASSRTTCINNGVPDVNNCAQCFCPMGYGGRDCSGNPAGSIVLSATASEQRYETTIAASAAGAIEYQIKHLVITAPAGKKVQLKVPYFWVGFDVFCTWGGIEFYTNTDTRMGAPRVCKMEWLESSYTSEGARMYIRLFNRADSQATYQFTYK
ncbi:hypothetical protein PMAYCL1PPCAC_30611, partial [Pristionchus mayeri]